MRSFSTNYPTFSSWLKSTKRTSRYAREIIKKHSLAPNKTLSELRRLRISDLDISRTPLSRLSSDEITHRSRALQVLIRMRRGFKFTEALEGIDISQIDVKRHLGGVLFHKRRRVFAKPVDYIQRRMLFYENGQVTSIVVRNSRDATLIAEYMNDVKKAIKGDISVLKKYKYRVIIDADGVKHYFETDPEIILAIEDMKEDSEFYEEVYRWE